MNLTSTNFKKRRTRLSLSQFAVAKFSKVSRYNLSLFENGYRDLTTMEKIKVNEFLNKKEREIEDVIAD